MFIALFEGFGFLAVICYADYELFACLMLLVLFTWFVLVMCRFCFVALIWLFYLSLESGFDLVAVFALLICFLLVDSDCLRQICLVDLFWVAVFV